MIERIDVVELFGGIGALRKAMDNLNINYNLKEYIENDKNAVKSYNALYEENFLAKDIRDVSLKEIGNIDILMHGSPCQDFSVLGKQMGGVKDSGTRSSLLYETLRIIEEMKYKPKVVIWENVKGVLYKKMINTFYNYLEEMKKLGYENSYKILNAKDFGMPQNRERVFVVSVFKGEKFQFNNLNFREMKPISEYLEDTLENKYIIKQPSMLEAINKKKGSTNFKLDIIKTYCNTLTTRQMIVPNAGIIKIGKEKYRILTEKECFRLMGFSDEDFNKVIKVHKLKANFLCGILYRQAGNSIVVNVLEEILKECLKVIKK